MTKAIITPVAANDNYYRALAGDGSDLPSPIRYLPHEVAGVEAQKRRLAKLPSSKRGPDWMDVPANDNQAWPLAKALLTEKNYDLLLAAVRYRQIEWAATTGHHLMGASPTADMSVVHESEVNDDGSIAYGRVRRSKSAEAVATAPGRRARPTCNDGGEPAWSRAAAAPRKWTGDDRLHRMIDAKRILEKLRIALGAMAEPLEAMVVEGETYERVGRRFGVGNRAGAIGFARGVAHLGLLTASDVLSEYTQIGARTPMDGKAIAAMAAEWEVGNEAGYRHQLQAAA